VALPKLNYQLFFDKKMSEAVIELDKNIRRTVRATLRTVASPPPDGFLTSQTSFLDAWKDVAEVLLAPFISALLN
jgi:soluble epoxide hydrolase/lipid-phosphate phosphatase